MRTVADAPLAAAAETVGMHGGVTLRVSGSATILLDKPDTLTGFKLLAAAASGELWAFCTFLLTCSHMLP